MTLDLPVWAALPAGLLLIAGGLFALIGSLGLLRLRDF
jgi:multicomponent K+:H+ antiporter subunit G